MLTSNLYKFCMSLSDMFGLNIFNATLKYFITNSLSCEPYRSAEILQIKILNNYVTNEKYVVLYYNICR